MGGGKKTPSAETKAENNAQTQNAKRAGRRREGSRIKGSIQPKEEGESRNKGGPSEGRTQMRPSPQARQRRRTSMTSETLLMSASTSLQCRSLRTSRQNSTS